MGYHNLGEHQKALEGFGRALEQYRKVGHQVGEAMMLHNVGLAFNGLGNKQKAVEYYEGALKLHRQLGNKEGEAQTLDSLGLVYGGLQIALGDKQKAFAYFDAAQQIYAQLGDQGGQAWALVRMGNIQAAQGQAQEALKNFDCAELGKCAIYFACQRPATGTKSCAEVARCQFAASGQPESICYCMSQLEPSRAHYLMAMNSCMINKARLNPFLIQSMSQQETQACMSH